MSTEELQRQIERYLDKTLSSGEKKQLLHLYRQGELEGIIGEDVERILDEESDVDVSPGRAGQILANVFAGDKKVVPIRRGWIPAWVAAAAVVVITTTVGLLLYRNDFLQRNSIAQTESSMTISGKNYVSFPDGSTALLSEGSRITYGASFGKNTREVVLTGKAYFEVTPDRDKPFIVHTGNIQTKVLGTAFSVEGGSHTEAVTVTVTHGKVSVGNDTKVFDQLTPDQQITVNTSSFTFEKKTVKANEVTAWRNDFFVLNHVTMQRAAEMISERYEVTASIANENLKNCIVSARFVNNEPLEVVVAMIAGSRQAEYEIQGKKVIITGGTACDEKAN